MVFLFIMCIDKSLMVNVPVTYALPKSVNMFWEVVFGVPDCLLASIREGLDQNIPFCCIIGSIG